MSTRSLPDATHRLIPPIFDWVVLFLVLQAHVLAVVVIVPSLAEYRSVAGCVALLAGSVATSMGCVVAVRWRGYLSVSAFVVAGALLVMVDIAQVALMRTPNPGAPAVWTWGAIGVTVLTFAAYRPARDVLMLGAAHTLVAVGFLSWSLPHGRTSFFQAVGVVSSCVIPTLVAAQYLRFYVEALSRREPAVRARLAIETRMVADAAVQRDTERRLQALRAEVLPLLASVAAGSVAVDDPDMARQARRLARALRQELVDARSGRWLLEPRSAGPSQGERADGEWPGIVLLDPSGLAVRLRTTDRTALSALLGMLRSLSGWQRVSVILTRPSDSPDSVNEGDGSEDAGAATMTIVGIGPAATDSSRDPDVAAAVVRLGALISSESDGAFIAKVQVVLGPPDESFVVTHP